MGVIRELLWRAIDSLPPDERAAVVLVHIAGYDVESEDPNNARACSQALRCAPGLSIFVRCRRLVGPSIASSCPG